MSSATEPLGFRASDSVLMTNVIAGKHSEAIFQVVRSGADPNQIRDVERQVGGPASSVFVFVVPLVLFVNFIVPRGCVRLRSTLTSFEYTNDTLPSKTGQYASYAKCSPLCTFFR
jgi:hypothetical protein